MRQLRRLPFSSQLLELDRHVQWLITELERGRLPQQLGDLAAVLNHLAVLASDAEWHAVLDRERDEF